MLVMDGNDSTKRLDRPGLIASQQEFATDRILSPSFVDKYKDEVKKRPAKPAQRSKARTKRRKTGEEPDFEAEDNGADVEDLPPCADNWKAAKESGKESKTMDKFVETGTFACFCTHGFQIISTDMIKSGEL
jgi:hypothetical protein